jgi:hypothetical protein
MLLPLGMLPSYAPHRGRLLALGTLLALGILLPLGHAALPGLNGTPPGMLIPMGMQLLTGAE